MPTPSFDRVASADRGSPWLTVGGAGQGAAPEPAECAVSAPAAASSFPSLPGARAVRRSRLLDRVASARLVVLSAPSGYGKSTLAAQVAEGRGGGVVSCRLTDADATDAGAARLLDALASAYPHLGEQPPVVDRTGGARLAYALTDLAGPATVVIDGLHLLDDDGDRLLSTVLDAADPTVSVVAIIDTAAPSSVARRAATGEAVILGAAELLFDPEECEALAQLVGSDLGGVQLADRSGGWALAAAAIARSAPGVEEVLATDVLGELGTSAQAVLSVLGLVASVPVDAVDPAVASELRRFADRHPALLQVDPERWAVRDLLRAGRGAGDALSADTTARAAVVDVADRLERLGHADEALVLLSRVGGDRRLLQERLDAVGAAMLDAGRFAFLRRLITEVPPSQRTAVVQVLDAAAALGLDQIEAGDGPGFRIDDAQLESLAAELTDRADPAVADDLRLAVAGLRTEFLRRRGDVRLVEVALEAVALVGSVDQSASAAELVADRHPLARRGLFQVLYGLGAAAQFSGDAGMIAEGERLIDLAFRVAECSGLDVVPLRGQSAYERSLIGLAWPIDVLTPLEEGAAALESIGHPEAANLLVELADTHLRCTDAAAALAVAESAEDWARRTGNELAMPTAALVRAGAELLRDGPSAANDRALDAAWRGLVATPRLRRAQPSLAVRVANALLDHGDTERAAQWLERARTRFGDLVQSSYQQQFLASVEERMSIQLGHRPTPLAGDDDLFAAQPAGRLERWATFAWDARRRGDDRPARHLLATTDELPRPWSERLGAAASSVPAPSRTVVRLLCPEVRVERDGHTVATPTGHAGRLLAQLVLAEGALTVDAVVDDLWPEADPGVARNRLHQVLHRLRRTLNVAADGPITVTDGVLRLDGASIHSDVAALRSLDPSDRGAALEAVRSYASDLCAAQFAYDDAFDDARWELSSRLHDVAVALLAGDGARDPEITAAVWDAWVRLADEDRIGLVLADALERVGQDDRAAEIRDRVTGRPDPPSPG